MASLILVAMMLGFMAPAEAEEPAAVEQHAPEPPSPPTSELQREPLTPEGVTPIGRRTQKGWVPNSWPVQQRCDFLTTDRQACVTVRGEVFTGYRYSAVGSQNLGEFRLDRGELGSGFVWRPNDRIDGGVTLQMEAVRSAGPQSLIGVDGNSLVVRMLEAYGQMVVHASPIDIGVRVGLVPERWIEQVEKGYDTRGLVPLPSDDGTFFDRSDLGASLTVSGWKGRAELDVQYVNGEGRAQQELNAGKNTEALLTVRPLLRKTDRGPMTLAIHGAYRDGSLGIASLRNHRGAAAVTFASVYAYGGVEYVHALGYGARAEVEANGVGIWGSGHLWKHYLGVMAKYDRVQQDTSDGDSVIQRITAGVFSDAFGYLDRNRRRLRLHAAYQYEGYGDAAGPLRGSADALTTHRFLLQLRARGLMRLW